jgi:signal transduction histidine kinase
VALYTEALLEREPNLTERGRSQLEIIQRAVDDIAQTVARMGEFYRLREPQLTLIPVDLNKLVGHVIDLTRARWSDMAQQRGAAIEMRTELDPNLPMVAAVESQIRDALVNLVFNAVDAMPDGGPITIRTHLAMGSRDQIVLLEVQDAGIGMDEDTRRRCLEPFFTTKGTRGHGPRPRDGVRRGATSRRQPRNRKRARQGLADPHDLRDRGAAVRRDERTTASARRARCASSSSMTIRCC